MILEVKIPKKRIPILIGKDGSTKKEIENLTHTKIEINEGITVKGEAINLMEVENIIKAIGRGFPPEKALELLDEEVTLCIVSLDETEDKLKRIKSRIIGTGGKAKRNIERLTHTDISVYGKTVSIIGKYDDVDIARRGIEKLITGAPHKNVYNFLEKVKR